MAHRSAGALVAASFLAAGALGVAAPQQARADTTTPAGCVEAKQVWVVVADDHGRQLASKCVGTPATGTKALEATGLSIQKDSKGLLCAIGGYPNPCPASFNGQYWNYYQLKADGSWGYSATGADQSKPAPGGVEGWCYNAKGTKSCMPPAISLTGAAPAASAAATATSAAASAQSSTSAAGSAGATTPAPAPASQEKGSGPGALLGALALLVLAGLGSWLWRRRNHTAA